MCLFTFSPGKVASRWILTLWSTLDKNPMDLSCNLEKVILEAQRSGDSNMIPTLVQQLVQYDSNFPKKSKEYIEYRSIYFFKISFLSGVEIRNPRCHEMRMPGGDCTSDIFLWVTFCRRPHFKSEILRFCPVAWRSSRICSAKADMREGLHSFEKPSLRSIQVHFPTNKAWLCNRRPEKLGGSLWSSPIRYVATCCNVSLPFTDRMPLEKLLPLRLCIWSCFSFAEHIRTSFNCACCKQVCCKRVFPRKKQLNQAESKEIPSLGSPGKINSFEGIWRWSNLHGFLRQKDLEGTFIQNY